MATEITVTTTPDVILRHAVELVSLPRPAGESFWEKQAAGLDEIGYTIVGKDDAAELQRLRALVTPPVDPMQVAGLGQARELIRSLDEQLEKLRTRVAELEPIEQRAREVYAEPPVHEHDHTARGTAVRILGYRP